MERDPKTFQDLPTRPLVHRIGFRLLVCIVALFAVTLVLFEGLDIRHESEAFARLGATPAQVESLRSETVLLHAIHGGVAVLAFAVGIFVTVRFLITRRIRAILLAIHRFRLGTWRARIPPHDLDELEWLAEAFRQLGPHLEGNFNTYVECDRRATVARMGLEYEKVLVPLARRLLTIGSSAQQQGPDRGAWLEVKETAGRILAELGRLGRPEHPAMAQILGPVVGSGGALPLPAPRHARGSRRWEDTGSELGSQERRYMP